MRCEDAPCCGHGPEGCVPVGDWAHEVPPCWTCGSSTDCDCTGQDAPTDRDYCRHGNYVGNWTTGDYLCGRCEDGEK